MRSLLILLVFTSAIASTLSCVKQKKTDKYKTSELVPHFTRTVSSPTVTCDAWFSLESDSSNAAVTLEEDAVMTCNGTVMLRSGAGFVQSITYVPQPYGMDVSISLIRAIDGTNLTDTEKVY